MVKEESRKREVRGRIGYNWAAISQFPVSRGAVDGVVREGGTRG